MPGHPVRISLQLNGGGNYARVWITNAPARSRYKAELAASGASRIQIFEGGKGEVWEFTPDVGGTFIFRSQEYTRGGIAFGGGFKGDPDGRPTETFAPATEDLFSISVMERLTWPVGTGKDVAELALWVRGTRIRATTVALNGETTPALMKPRSEKAKLACADSSAGGVLEQVSALANMTATEAIGDAATITTNIIDKYNAHRTQGGVHSSNDAINIIASAFRNPVSPDALLATVREILTKLDRHMRNDNAGAGTGTSGFHSSSDMTNNPVAAPPGDLASAFAALADCWRAYEAHRVLTGGVHSSADTTNTLTALSSASPLLELQKRFIAVTASLSPPVPETANAGVAVLSGFMTESS
jgi:hypothetical protein